MVNWRTLEAKVDKTIGDAFDEEVRHYPYKKDGTVDPSRPITSLRGVLHTPSPEGTINIGAGVVTNMAASEGALVVQRADMGAVIFRPKDVIVGLELDGSPKWEIKTVNDRYSSIIVLTLNQK